MEEDAERAWTDNDDGIGFAANDEVVKAPCWT